MLGTFTLFSQSFPTILHHLTEIDVSIRKYEGGYSMSEMTSIVVIEIEAPNIWFHYRFRIVSYHVYIEMAISVE